MVIVIPKVRFRDTQVEMAHGAGGKASRRLVEGLFAPLLFGSSSEPLGDAAHVNMNGTCVAVTTDSFVVKPLTFPGGSIGELAVNGTVNDLAVSGARAEAMVVSYILEAGLPTEVLEAEVRGVATSLNELARDCGLGILLSEEWIPVRDQVRGACELLGLDPLHIANEGQLLAVVAPECAEQALDALQGTPGGEDAVIIGEVSEEPAGSVLVTTPYGGSRIV